MPKPGVENATRLDGGNGHRNGVRAPAFGFDSDARAASERAARDSSLLFGLQTLDGDRPPLAFTNGGLRVRHPDLAPLLVKSHNPDSLGELRKRLTTAGTFSLHTDKGHSVTVDGEPQQITIVKATPAEVHGDMDGQVWIRDQNEAVITKLRKLKYDPHPSQQDREDARDLLLSTLHLMSTDGQVGEQNGRFKKIIRNNELADNYLEWPQIALEITPDNRKLESAEPTNWRHTQEAFQKLAISAFDALDMGVITTDQLKDGNKEFLASLMPFLAAVNFTKRPNSGPWEEVMAVRTSVIGDETALLLRILAHADKPGFEFLKEGFEEAKVHLMNSENTSFSAGSAVTQETDLDPNLVSMIVDDYVRPSTEGGLIDPALEHMTIADIDSPLTQETTFDQALISMVVKGLVTVGQKVPSEAPDQPGTIKYRTADIALIDLLEYGLPEYLSRYHIGIKAFGGEAGERMAIEDLILGKVGELYDKETNCLFRYGAEGEPQDTYLQGNFATDSIQWEVTQMKKRLADAAQGGPIDLDAKAAEREVITKGKPAAWLHPNFGIAAWADEMVLRLRSEQLAGRDIPMAEIDHYKRIADETLNRGAAGLTGPGEHRPVLNGDGTHHIAKVGELQATESWITMEVPDGSKIVVASPHSPLEWGATLADRAFDLHMRALLALAA